MPRPEPPNISGSICNYITAEILSHRAKLAYPHWPTIARIWEKTAHAWHNRVLNDWGW